MFEPKHLNIRLSAQYLICMILGINLFNNLLNNPLLINYKSGSQHTHIRLAIHLLFAPDSIILKNAFSGSLIRLKRKPYFLAKF